MSPESSEAVKSIADGVAVAGTVGVVIKILLAVASVFTILWFGVRTWESETVKKLTGRD